MNNKVFLLWLEGVQPERFSTVPLLMDMAQTGSDVQLMPLPLSEKSLCYYQTATGMGAGKMGRFDRVYPQNYRAVEESGLPEGVLGRLLPEVLRARKLTVTFLETAQPHAVPSALSADCTIVRLSGMQHAEKDVFAALMQRCAELVKAETGTHMLVLTDVWSEPPHTLVNVNDFLAEVGLLEAGEQRKRETMVWSETLAYGLGSGQVWLNLRGRETQGLVSAGKEYQDVCDALIHALTTSWRDPRTDQLLVERVLRKEEAYQGDFLFKAPDLTVVYRPGYAPSPRAAALDFDGASTLPADGAPAALAAPHARMIAWGPSFAQGYQGSAQLVDVLPSMLYLLGQAVPTALDGTVHLPLFSSAYRQKTPLEQATDDEDQLSEEEEGLIVDRLRDLGYLG